MGKIPYFWGLNPVVRGEKRCRERTSDFSLRSTELRRLSRVRPRLKVRVLVEGNMWTPKPGFFVGDSSGKFGKPCVDVNFLRVGFCWKSKSLWNSANHKVSR